MSSEVGSPLMSSECGTQCDEQCMFNGNTDRLFTSIDTVLHDINDAINGLESKLRAVTIYEKFDAVENSCQGEEVFVITTRLQDSLLGVFNSCTIVRDRLRTLSGKIEV